MKKIIRLLRSAARKIIKAPSQFYYTITGKGVECIICHQKAGRLRSDAWHQYSICTQCGSGVRHRLLWASLTLLPSFDEVIKNKKVLHFAPDKQFRKLIKSAAKEYKTADLLTEGYSYYSLDYNIDISAMKEINDASFDCVIASDVLEHVPDYIEGIKEVHRVLSPGGYCIFTVPQKDNLKITYEDLSITSPQEREKAFGQFDHLRIFGDDFKNILSSFGFEVTAVDENYFDRTIAEKYVLFPPVLSANPLATNYRKVFFGKKK